MRQTPPVLIPFKWNKAHVAHALNFQKDLVCSIKTHFQILSELGKYPIITTLMSARLCLKHPFIFNLMQMLFLSISRFKIVDVGYHLNLLGLNVPFPWDCYLFECKEQKVLNVVQLTMRLRAQGFIKIHLEETFLKIKIFYWNEWMKNHKEPLTSMDPFHCIVLF